MPNGMLADRTVVISGGSCGIGLAIGVAAAKRGANVVLLAKTDTPHPHLPGTVHTADAAVEAAAGRPGKPPLTAISMLRCCGPSGSKTCPGTGAESSRLPDLFLD